MAWEVLTMAPRMSGRLMRTGGMTKGLLGFIGAFYIQRPKAPPAKAARTPNVILNKVYKANIP